MTDARWPGWPFKSADPRMVPQPSDQEPHYPVRESDGAEWHVGTLVDLRQLRIEQARQDALRYLALASIARSDAKWAVYMRCAARSRAKFAGLLRCGGRVDWRGHPVSSTDQRIVPQLCECDLEHMTCAAVQTNRCASCGKPLIVEAQP